MFNKIQKRKFFVSLWTVAVVLSLASLAFFSKKVAGSLSIGASLMVLNFYTLFYVLENLMGENSGRIGFYIGLLALKFLVLAGVIYLLYRFTHLNFIALGAGFFLVAISATYVTAGVQKNITPEKSSDL